MDSTLCASADPGNFLVTADAAHQSRYLPATEVQNFVASLTVTVRTQRQGMRCSVAEVSAAALQEMNPLVKVKVQPGAVGATDINSDMGFLASFQVPGVAAVCGTGPAGCGCTCHCVRVIAILCPQASVCGMTYMHFLSCQMPNSYDQSGHWPLKEWEVTQVSARTGAPASLSSSRINTSSQTNHVPASLCSFTADDIQPRASGCRMTRLSAK